MNNLYQYKQIFLKLIVWILDLLGTVDWIEKKNCYVLAVFLLVWKNDSASCYIFVDFKKSPLAAKFELNGEKYYLLIEFRLIQKKFCWSYLG